MALSWSAGLFTTALAIAALVGAVRVVLMTWRAEQPEPVAVPFDATPLDDVHEVKQAAA